MGAKQSLARKQRLCSTETEPMAPCNFGTLLDPGTTQGNLWHTQDQRQKMLHFKNISWVMVRLLPMENPLPACLSANSSRSEALSAHTPCHVTTGKFGWICVGNFPENAGLI